MFNSGNDMSGDESHVVGKSTHDNKSKHNSNSKNIVVETGYNLQKVKRLLMV